MLQIQCLQSKTTKGEALFSRFAIGPLRKGQGVTIGNTLRRILLADLSGIAIVGVRISGINHEFATIPDVKEDVIDILLNLKQIVLKGNITEPIIARLCYQGPGIITADDILLPNEIQKIEPRQYIATSNSNRIIEMDFLIKQGTGYMLTNSNSNVFLDGFLSVDAVFMPVRKVNFFIETAPESDLTQLESLILEISTNGSISPTEAISRAAEMLQQIFQPLQLKKSINQLGASNTEKEQTGEQKGFENVMIEELELSVRAFNCLKRANIHTLSQLLKYSQMDLLEFKNFGQKSADEVCLSLKTKFGKVLH